MENLVTKDDEMFGEEFQEEAFMLLKGNIPGSRIEYFERRKLKYFCYEYNIYSVPSIVLLDLRVYSGTIYC